MTGWPLPVALLAALCLACMAAGEAEEGSCPAGGGAGCGPTPGGHGEYLWPHGRGHPRYHGQSPYAFGGRACNLSASLKWTWHHPEGRYAATLVGKPIVDDEVNIYLAAEDGIRKLAPDGRLLWTWTVSPFDPSGRAIPNHPAIMDGLLFDCLTSGEVFALSMASGELVWMAKVSHRGIGGDTAFTVAREGLVILDVDAPSPPHGHNRVVALNATNGDLVWEYRPETGVWNFLPFFPLDGSLLFQSWSGAPHRLDLSSGKPLWRQGRPSGVEPWSWTDGGAALGPNGVLYTVSSKDTQMSSMGSTGGGLHAYRVRDGELLWERRDFEHGIYTYPVVGRLDPESPRLSVVTGEGSLGFVPLKLTVAAGMVVAGLPGATAGLLLGCLFACCGCPWCKRATRRALAVKLAKCALIGALLATTAFMLQVLPRERARKNSVQAFDAETGERQWTVALPPWHDYSSAGDAEGMLGRGIRGRRLLCLPLASSYPTLDSQGILYFGHLDGRIYRIKDWDGNGRIEGESELCSFDAGSAFPTGGPTIVPGMLLATSCDTLYVFENK